MSIDFNLMGLTYLELLILFTSLFIVLLLELISIKVDIEKWFYKRNIIFRWLFYYILLFFIIIFGIYGPLYDASEFIYFQF